MSVISKPTQRNIDVLKEELDRQIAKQMSESLERHFRSNYGPTGDLEGLLIVDKPNIMSFPEYVSMVGSGNWASGLTNWEIDT